MKFNKIDDGFGCTLPPPTFTPLTIAFKLDPLPARTINPSYVAVQQIM